MHPSAFCVLVHLTHILHGSPVLNKLYHWPNAGEATLKNMDKCVTDFSVKFQSYLQRKKKKTHLQMSFTKYWPCWRGGHLNIKMSSYQYRIPMLKIRRSCDRLIFNMEIPIPGKGGLYIETGTRSQSLLGLITWWKKQHNGIHLCLRLLCWDQQWSTMYWWLLCQWVSARKT